MVIGDLYIVGCAITPDEAEPPLAIDSNAVLPFPLPSQWFQPIAGDISQIRKFIRSVELPQFPPGYSLDIAEARTGFVQMELLGIFRSKAFYHIRII